MKLTVKRVVAVRAAVRAGARVADLAQEYGVALPTMKSAVNGSSWIHVPDPVRGRVPRSSTKLSPERVATARRAALKDRSVIADLARDWDVGYATVANAVYGITWRGLADPPPLPRPVPGPRTRPKLDEEAVREMRRLYVEETRSLSELAAQFGVNDSTVSSAVHGYTWRDVPGAVPVGRAGLDPVLDEEEVAEARRLRDEGLSFRSIGISLRVSGGTVQRALARCGR